jgi:hypothetical protein
VVLLVVQRVALVPRLIALCFELQHDAQHGSVRCDVQCSNERRLPVVKKHVFVEK